MKKLKTQSFLLLGTISLCTLLLISANNFVSAQQDRRSDSEISIGFTNIIEGNTTLKPTLVIYSSYQEQIKVDAGDNTSSPLSIRIASVVNQEIQNLWVNSTKESISVYMGINYFRLPEVNIQWNESVNYTLSCSVKYDNIVHNPTVKFFFDNGELKLESYTKVVILNAPVVEDTGKSEKRMILILGISLAFVLLIAGTLIELYKSITKSRRQNI